MSLDFNVILGSFVGAGIGFVARELIISYLRDRLKASSKNKRAIAEDLLRYCSGAEAKDYIPPYEKVKEIYLLNSLAGLNKGYGSTFKEFSVLLEYNELASNMEEEEWFQYKDKRDILQEIKKLLLDLKKISYKLKK